MDKAEIIAAFAQRLETNAAAAEKLHFSVANLSTLPIEHCRLIAEALRDSVDRGAQRKAPDERPARRALCRIAAYTNEDQTRAIAEQALTGVPANDPVDAGRGDHAAASNVDEVALSVAKRIVELVTERPAQRLAQIQCIVIDALAGAQAKPRAEIEFVPTQPLAFTYRNYKGELSVRRVSPQRIRFGSTEWHPEPQYLLRAFDLDKQAMRDFAFSEINAPADSDAALSSSLLVENLNRALENGRLRKLLEDVRDRGLIYWEPNTDRGHVSKALMLKAIEQTLSGGGSDGG